MTNDELIKKSAEVLSDPRNHKDEVQALQDTIYILGGKWRLLIINSICNGNNRFREIQRSIPGLTTKMLSKELKEMEANLLISRTESGTAPVLVEYRETDYCLSFGGIILEMISWGKTHRERIREISSRKR
jgi:DNA-binding HxlR family transcriptional regulator